MNGPNLLEGATIKSEDARTTSIPESAGTVPAHDPNHVSTLGVYKPKPVKYGDDSNQVMPGGKGMC